MRIAVLILSILGSLAALGVGGLLFVGLNTQQVKEQQRMERELIATLPGISAADRESILTDQSRRIMLPYPLLAAVPLGIVAGVLAMLRWRILAAVLLLLSVVGPWVLALMIVTARQPDLGPFLIMPQEGQNRNIVVLVLTLIPTSFLGLGGLLAFFIGSKPALPGSRAYRRDEYEEEEGYGRDRR